MGFMALLLALVTSYLLPKNSSVLASSLMRRAARTLRMTFAPYVGDANTGLVTETMDAPRAQRKAELEFSQAYWVGVLVFVGLIFAVFALYWLINALALTLGSVAQLLLHALLLYLLLGFWHVARRLNARALHEHKREGRESRTVKEQIALGRELIDDIEAVHRHGFALLFWFAVLPGAYGALLYWVTNELVHEWCEDRHAPENRFADAVWTTFYWLDWLPQRVSALSFAAVGNFEDAFACWKTQSRGHFSGSLERVVAAGAGAVGVKLAGFDADATVEQTDDIGIIGIGNTIDASSIEAIEAMLWRTMGLWLVLGLLLTLARAA
jgi:adenosylcobinamide-phosphate synthase